MHALVSGVVKQLTREILKKLSPYQREQIDEILLKIRAPTSIVKLTQIISTRSEWKARDWENYLLFYSLPIMEFVKADEDILEHWSLLVNSAHILLGDKIALENLKIADNMLREFVVKTQSIYGEKNMTYNVHLLLHLARSVYNLGPLQTQSTYPYESQNGKIADAIYSANGVQSQIIRYINLNQTIETLKNIVYPDACMHVKEFFDDCDSKREKNCVKVADGIYFNSECMKDYRIMKEKFNLTENAKFFFKMFTKGCVFDSSLIVNERSCNSFAKLRDGRYVKINYFVNDSVTNNYCICEILNTMPHYLTDYIHVCYDDASIQVCIDVKDISKQCVLMEIGDLKFLSSRPNSLSY